MEIVDIIYSLQIQEQLISQPKPKSKIFHASHKFFIQICDKLK